jgi:hypothetical protein
MYSVHNRNLALVYLENNNIADGELLSLHPKKKNITTAKGRLHAATKYNYYRTFAVADHHKKFPYHEGGCHYEAQ